MSAKGKLIAYRVFLVVCGIASLVGTVVIALNGVDPAKGDGAFIWAFAFAIVSLVVLPLNTLVHELGHLLFGLIAGMRFSSVRFGRFRLVRIGKKLHFRFLTGKEVAGSCEMYPKDEKRVKERTIAYSLGGALFNLAFGVAFVVSCILLPPHPALYFFQLFAPISLLEAAASLFPVETATGSTDGEVIRSLRKNEPSAVVALHVLTAQGTLAYSDFSALSRELLFSVPVVREDEPCFLALTQLRWQYLFFMGDEEGALKELSRLQETYCYLPEINRGDVACDLVYAYCALMGNAAGAEDYLVDSALAGGSCAYFRAMAAYEQSAELREGYVARAKDLIAREPIRGIAALEERFLARIA